MFSACVYRKQDFRHVLCLRMPETGLPACSACVYRKQDFRHVLCPRVPETGLPEHPGALVLRPVSKRIARAEYFVSLQGGDAVASLTGDNAADGKIDDAESVIAGR